MRGLRRSPSTKQTVEPACAIAIAKLAAVVDFPSSGPAEVNTKLRGLPSTRKNCRFVRKERNASARGLVGSSCTRSGRVDASGSNTMRPKIGSSVMAAMSARVRTRVSRTERSTAKPNPKERPRSTPSAKLRFTFGLSADPGTCAGWTMSTCTRAGDPSLGFSNWFMTTSANTVDVVLAMRAASSGSSFTADTLIRTVFEGDDAVTADAS